MAPYLLFCRTVTGCISDRLPRRSLTMNLGAVIHINMVVRTKNDFQTGIRAGQQSECEMIE